MSPWRLSVRHRLKVGPTAASDSAHPLAKRPVIYRSGQRNQSPLRTRHAVRKLQPVMPGSFVDGNQGRGERRVCEAPTATMRRFGLKSPSQYKEVPQFGQKWKRTLRPSAPARSKSFHFPSVVTSAFSKTAPLPATAPVLRWQSRQWHRLTISGSPEVFARSDPQWHCASLFMSNLACFAVHPDGHSMTDVGEHRVWRSRPDREVRREADALVLFGGAEARRGRRRRASIVTDSMGGGVLSIGPTQPRRSVARRVVTR